MFGFLYMTLSAVNVKYKMRERNNIIIRKKKIHAGKDKLH